MGQPGDVGLYVTEVIVPFCSASDAAFVVDSHAPHISELTGDLYAHHSITPIQVPEGMTTVYSQTM